MSLAFSAAVGQSPVSRMNGQNAPLAQAAGIDGFAATAGCIAGAGAGGAAMAAGIATASVAALGAAGVVPLALSAAVAQSPDARMNGQNVPFVQPAGVDGFATTAGCIAGAGGGGGATAAGIATASVAALGAAGVMPLALPAAVGQSPDSRINGQNVPLVQAASVAGLTVATGCTSGDVDAAEAGVAASVLSATGTVDVVPLPDSAAVGQSAASRTNGHKMPL